MKYMDIVFTDNIDEELNPCVNEFNNLCDQGFYPGLLEWTHVDFAKRSEIPNVTLWKHFLLNAKVKDWYQQEQAIQTNAQIQQLMKTAAKSGSTATVQTLNALLSQQKALQDATKNQTIIIYNFIPINDEERKSGRINVVQNIPSGIRRAIKYIEDPTDLQKK